MLGGPHQRALAVAALAITSACTTENRSVPAPTEQPLVVSLRAVRELGWIGRAERPTVAGETFSIAPTGARPALTGSLSTSGVRISAAEDAWIEIDPIEGSERLVPSRVQDGLVSFSRDGHVGTVWAWSPRAVEQLHVRRDPHGPLAMHLRLGPRITSFAVDDGRVVLRDATGYALLQTDPAWVEDARGTRRPVSPTLVRSPAGLRLELEWDGDDLVPPIVIDPAWTKVASMSQPRKNAPIVALSDGRVLVVGGEVADPYRTFEIYSPTTNSWSGGSGIQSFGAKRSSAARLTSGKVLVVGASAWSATQLFDPSTATWTTSSLVTGRHTAGLVALADGRALVAGGLVGATTATSAAEIYDPTTNTFTAVAPMSVPREAPAVHLLSDGRVLVAGGRSWPTSWSSTEIFSPTTGTWSSGPAMPRARAGAVGITLADGRFVVAGGYLGAGAEIYSGGAWTSVAATSTSFTTAGAPFGANRALFATNCATAGCWDGIQVFDGSGLVAADPPFDLRLAGAMVAPLPLGRVLVVGGDGTDLPLSSAEIFSPQALGAPCKGSGTCAAGLSCVDSVCCESASCPTTHSCAGPADVGKCRLKKGEACSTASSCASGLCVDGVCCDRACNNQCEACDGTGTRGTCVPIAGAPHGSRPKCTTTAAACGPTCDGIDPSKCVLASTTTPCGSDACTGGIETHARLCDGAGSCTDVPKACGAYACGKTTCKTSCATSTDCASGFGCKGGLCVPTEGLGKPCSSGGECTGGACVDGVCCASFACGAGSVCNLAGKEGRCEKTLGAPCAATAECGVGTCVDGVCCDSACAGVCEACDVPGKEGRCNPVLGAPHGARAACSAGEGPCDARVCDGKDRATCAGYAKGRETICAPPSCDAGAFVSAARCDGAGACGMATKSSCAPFVCGDGACRTTCTADADCQSGFRCISGRCIDAAARCTDDSMSSEASDGRTVSCSPYRCASARGTCLGSCLSSDDCAAGFACSAGACTAPPTSSTDEGDGGCAYSSRRSATWLPLLMIAIAATLLRRRVAPAFALLLLSTSCAKREPSTRFDDVAPSRPALDGRTWSTATGTIASAILTPVIVPMPDGSALIFGSDSGVSSNGVYKLAAGSSTITKVGALLTARFRPACARLTSGKVLVAGGIPAPGSAAVSTSEIFDPVTGTSVAGPSMSKGRVGSAFVALSTGDVLVASWGANVGEVNTTADRYVASSNTFQATTLSVQQDDGAMIRLPSGKALLVGSGYNALLQTYEPTTNTWTRGPALLGYPRGDVRLANLPTGRVLIVGASTSFEHSSKPELYDPSTDTMSWSAPMPVRWYAPGVASLPSGRVIVAGGLGFSAVRRDPLVYRPFANDWIPAAPLAFGHSLASAASLADGRVLLAGTAPEVELFVEGDVGAACVAHGDCKNAQCFDGVCCSTAGCPTGSVCAPVSGTCKTARGGACTAGAQCSTGFCVDGVCCDSACTAQCAACNVGGKIGTCSPVTGVPRGTRAACSGPGLGTECGPRCDGIVSSACTFAPSSTTCGADACTSGIETKRSTCDGAGACKDTSLACAPYTCGSVTCRTSCTSLSDCAPGAYCKGSTCVPIEGLGASCTVGAECTSGHCVDGVCCATASCESGLVCNDASSKGRCVRTKGSSCKLSAECATGHCIDGVCCDTSCDGQCEACDFAGKTGTCTPVDGTPHGARPACPGATDDPDSACAARTCLGSKDARSCAGFAIAAGTSCAPSRCTTSSFVAAATCDGLGKCVAPEAASCAPYACNAEGCLTSCVLDLDCAEGWACRNTKCVREGNACTADLLASVDKDGKVTSCAPYRCRTDATCGTECATSDECAPGHVCDVASKMCSPAASSEDSGGCAIGSNAVPLPSIAALLALIGLFRRARTRGQRG